MNRTEALFSLLLLCTLSIGLEAQDKEYPERLKRADRPETTGRLREETGIETIPKKIGEPGWYEWGQFFREGFRQCVSHYLSELHGYSPGFQLACNWIYSPPAKQDHDQAGCSLGPEVLVLSRGSEFQLCFHQNPDGSLDITDLDVIEKVADFCRELQDYCQYSESVPQIGLIQSTEAHYRKLQRFFWLKNKEIAGLSGYLVKTDRVATCGGYGDGA
jgi:hypothetical protein